MEAGTVIKGGLYILSVLVSVWVLFVATAAIMTYVDRRS